MLVRRTGFTLIELLVVVSVISLMSSIVVSNINSARYKARLSAARSTMDNVFLAAVLCLADGKPLTGAGGGTEPCIYGGSFFSAPIGSPVCQGSDNTWPDIEEYGFRTHICMSDVINNQFVLLSSDVNYVLVCSYNFSSPSISNSARCELKSNGQIGLCSISGDICSCTLGTICPTCPIVGETCEALGS